MTTSTFIGMTYLWLNRLIMFEPKESYKHKIAKSLLAQWFQSQELKNDSCQVAQFQWRASYGVHEELIFYTNSSPFYFEDSQNDGNFLFVPDVTVFHKGTPKYLFEVYHKHKVPKYKIERIKRILPDAEVYEISANEILRHDSRFVPSELKCKRLQ